MIDCTLEPVALMPKPVVLTVIVPLLVAVEPLLEMVTAVPVVVSVTPELTETTQSAVPSSLTAVVLFAETSIGHAANAAFRNIQLIARNKVKRKDTFDNFTRFIFRIRQVTQPLKGNWLYG